MSDDRRDHRKTRQVSLSWLMSSTLAMLVFLAAAPVILIGYLIANDTAERLLSRQSEWIVDGLENQLRAQLDPVADQLHYVRQAVMDGLVDPDDPDALRTFTLGLLAGTPQVFGIGFIREDLSMRRWERDGFVEYIEPPDRLPFASAAMEAARAGRTAYWAAPFVSIALGDTILNHRVALERDGNLVGIVSVGVTGAGLSRYVAETSRQFQVTAFVLAGRDRVVTYPGLRAPQGAVTSTELPPLASVGDPVIARIWDDPRPLTQTGDLTRSAGHWTRVDGVPYGYYYRELEGYGPDPLIVGIAIPSANTWHDRWAATIAAGVGIVLMLLAAAAAWRLGRVLSRPAASFDGALNAIASLEFDKVALPDLVDSRVREWRTMARRLQSTARALLAFQTYLPRVLVRRLFDASAGSVGSQERIMTVMFVDLEGFTAFSRARGAGEVAAYLNEIFGLIGPIVEASGGVIDKYTGDGLLAFWGAPDAQPDHAARACHAAVDIARALGHRADRDGGGGPRLRIGLHSGSAIVGNIGFPGRIDYTLVGDTVNIAERTQAALRGVRPDLPAVIGATQEVLDAQNRADAILIRGEPLPAAPRPAFLCLPKD